MLNNFDPEVFIARYWQTHPLFIENAYPDFQTPITAEELAGLALEDFIDSRIISEHIQAPRWRFQHGPFTEQDFSRLPDSHWTLLVQSVNHLLPHMDLLLEDFTFLPSWRLDDIMVSYAASNGSVGPHVDQYDVFLIQAQGERHWQISTETNLPEQQIEGYPVRLVQDYTPTAEWIARPGDVLYLPPGVAHHGIALNECITISIGFRAPSYADLVGAYVDEKLSQLNEQTRFQDAQLKLTTPTGEITPTVITQIQDIFRQQMNDPMAITHWFGRFITEFLTPDNYNLDSELLSSSEFLRQFKSGRLLQRNPVIRCNYYTINPQTVIFFYNGTEQTCADERAELVRKICDQRILSYSEISHLQHLPGELEFLYSLYQNGAFLFADE